MTNQISRTSSNSSQIAVWKEMPALEIFSKAKELYMEVATVDDVAKSQSKSIKLLSNQMEKEKIVAVIAEMIHDLFNYLQLHSPMSNQAIIDTAKFIYIKCYDKVKCIDLKMADLILFFNKIKMGEYGIINYSTNGSFIISCMGRYITEKLDYYEAKLEYESQINKSYRPAKLPVKTNLYK